MDRANEKLRDDGNMPVQWRNAPEDFGDVAGAVHVWRLAARSFVLPGRRVDDAEKRGSIGAVERRAAQSFSRSAIRCLAARYLECEAREIGILADAEGRPFLTSGKPLDFNISHSDETLLVAFAWDKVGLDVEYGRRLRSSNAIARRYFSESEREYLDALPEWERRSAFVRMWVCKEAALKWVGCGLSGDLRQAVLIDPAPPYTCITYCGYRLTLVEFRPDDQAFAAVAVGQSRPVRFFQYRA